MTEDSTAKSEETIPTRATSFFDLLVICVVWLICFWLTHVFIKTLNTPFSELYTLAMKGGDDTPHTVIIGSLAVFTLLGMALPTLIAASITFSAIGRQQP